MIRQYELVERVKSYDPHADEDALNRAYVYTMKMHGGQLRASGDPYFAHPIEVAGILTGMKLDTASIITALLHDTIEDTQATLDDIRKMFGDEVAQLVDGVTKLSRLELSNQTEQSKQAENFRKLVLAMSEDIRVLLVKLADRLHNMRTLKFIKSAEKRQRIARETLEIYAPLAERIGITPIKEELQDLSFAELYPDVCDSILARLSYLKSEGGDLVATVVKELKDTLKENGLPDATVYGREKRPYSIWCKMERQNVAFEQLSDIVAFRIVVDSIEQCYQALGIIHGKYSVVPDLFNDYISTPKPNGYRSLHTTVIGPQKRRIEVQIRTQEMHEVNELGVAAHWSYKQGVKHDASQYRWLRELLEILEHAQKPEEFLEHTKLELFQDQVFCFTPKGDLIALPHGSTPVDFAYAVHSQVGDHCIGAKVNGRIVQLNTALKNGDQVEINTSKKQSPSPTWERFVVTGKARAHIRRFIRQQQQEEYAQLGRSMLQKASKNENHDFNDKLITPTILKRFQYETTEDLYAAIGAGLQGARDVFNAIYPEVALSSIEIKAAEDKKILETQRPLQKGDQKPSKKAAPLPIKGLIPGMAVHYARCCHPVPGDRIVGIITTGKGVTIHTRDCETLDSFAESPERWLDVAWESGASTPEAQTARIKAQISQETGSLGNLTTAIGKLGGNILNLKITSRSADMMELLLDVQVKDLPQLTNIMASLRAVESIYNVERMKGR